MGTWLTSDPVSAWVRTLLVRQLLLRLYILGMNGVSIAIHVSRAAMEGFTILHSRKRVEELPLL